MAKKTKPTTKPNDYDAPVNLDGDPIEARTTADGHFRPMLNRRERRVLKQKAQTREVIKLLLDGMDMPAIAEKLGIDLWELSYSMINLSGDEAREYIYNRTIDLILDVDRGRTRDEICRIVGITKSQLNTMISSDEFKVLYAEKFIKVRSDPNIELVRQRVIEDLLPQAFVTLRAELSTGAPWTVRQKARQDVFKLAGIEAQPNVANDRAEAQKFLSKYAIINVDIHNEEAEIIPAEYRDAFVQTLPPPKEQTENEESSPDISKHS